MNPDKLPPGYDILADSAFFWTGKELVGKIVRARKDDEMGAGGDVPESAFLLAIDWVLQRVMPSEAWPTYLATLSI